MADSSAVNCSHFEKIDDAFYFIMLRNETGFNTANLEQCRTEICLAVYGSGFPDISGVGVGLFRVNTSTNIGVWLTRTYIALCGMLSRDRFEGFAVWIMDRLRKNKEEGMNHQSMLLLVWMFWIEYLKI
jgi:hypothetical protein